MAEQLLTIGKLIIRFRSRTNVSLVDWLIIHTTQLHFSPSRKVSKLTRELRNRWSAHYFGYQPEREFLVELSTVY